MGHRSIFRSFLRKTCTVFLFIAVSGCVLNAKKIHFNPEVQEALATPVFPNFGFFMSENKFVATTIYEEWVVFIVAKKDSQSKWVIDSRKSESETEWGTRKIYKLDRFFNAYKLKDYEENKIYNQGILSSEQFLDSLGDLRDNNALTIVQGFNALCKKGNDFFTEDAVSSFFEFVSIWDQELKEHQIKERRTRAKVFYLNDDPSVSQDEKPGDGAFLGKVSTVTDIPHFPSFGFFVEGDTIIGATLAGGLSGKTVIVHLNKSLMKVAGTNGLLDDNVITVSKYAFDGYLDRQIRDIRSAFCFAVIDGFNFSTGQRRQLLTGAQNSQKMYQQFPSGTWHFGLSNEVKYGEGSLGKARAFRLKNNPAVQPVQRAGDITKAPVVQDPVIATPLASDMVPVAPKFVTKEQEQKQELKIPSFDDFVVGFVEEFKRQFKSDHEMVDIALEKCLMNLKKRGYEQLNVGGILDKIHGPQD